MRRAVLQVRTVLPNEWAQERAGTLGLDSWCRVLLRDDTDVYGPDGLPILFLRRGAIPEDVSAAAYPALHALRRYVSRNRGQYSAIPKLERRTDGLKTKTTQTEDAVASAIAGFYDRTPRFPFCRPTAFVTSQPEAWGTLLPMARAAAEALREGLPHRYRAQADAARRTVPDWVIPGTPFSTLTVNNNVAPSGLHRDAGDFRAGFGVISVARRGRYTGGLLCFPRFGVGVDLGDRDLVLFSPHEWHAVTPMERLSEDAERISVVYYLREKIVNCGTPSEELTRAKAARGGLVDLAALDDPTHDEDEGTP